MTSTPLVMMDVVFKPMITTALGQTLTTSAVAGEFRLLFLQGSIEVANPTRYAIERSSTYISIYFWERGSSSVPSEVKFPGSTVDTSTWVVNSYWCMEKMTDAAIRVRLRLTSRTRIAISHLILDL